MILVVLIAAGIGEMVGGGSTSEMADISGDSKSGKAVEAENSVELCQYSRHK